jgi:hypothetical protein
MLTLGFLALSVGLVPLAILFALGRVWTLEVAFVRLAWVPVAALALQVALWRPMTQTLSYGSIIPPLLTCIVRPILRHRRCHASRRGPDRHAASSTSRIHDARQRTWRPACRLHHRQLCPLRRDELSVHDKRYDEHRDRRGLPPQPSLVRKQFIVHMVDVWDRE